MITDEEAKEAAKKLLEYCNSRLNYYRRCSTCPFKTNGTANCIGFSLDRLDDQLEATK